MRTETSLERLARNTNGRLFGFVFVLLRVVVGLMFFMAGVAKFSGWSAESFLLQATGPFQTFFQSLAGSHVVDLLNIWGLTLIGAALILGLLVRPASLAGIVLMALYYFAAFDANTAQGFIDHHVVLALVFALFSCGGAGHVFGVNNILLASQRKPNAVVRFLLG